MDTYRRRYSLKYVQSKRLSFQQSSISSAKAKDKYINETEVDFILNSKLYVRKF